MDEPIVTQDPVSSEPDYKQEAETNLAGWKRAQADYQNLKKDTDRERTEFAKYANERLLEQLLPAIDQFGIALRFIPDLSRISEAERKSIENWIAGIKAVQSLWDQAATGVGLERIPAEGTFDPMLHEAVGEEVAEGMESGSIVRIVQDGWKLHGKVLRPTKVMVAK